MSEDTRLASLLLVWQEKQAQGRDVTADLCRDHPELATELAEQIQMLRQMNALLASADKGAVHAGPAVSANRLHSDQQTEPGERSADNLSSAPSVDDASESALSDTIAPTAPSARSSSAHRFLGVPTKPGDLGTLGGYRVTKLLGEGGMGFVFRGEDDNLQRPIALKVMRPEVAAKSGAKERFLREGRAVAKVKSEHVITIYQVGEANGVPFLAMEFLEGFTLDEWLTAQTRPVSVNATLKIARETLRGLATAHDKGLVHRDIKPANLWLEKPLGKVKVLDFGLTRGQDGADQVTADGAILGTPAYMAPEQAQAKQIDARADLFSVGAVLYRILAGKSPFQRDSIIATLGAVNFETVPSMMSVRSEVPESLSRFIDRLLAKDVAGRPADGKAALNELIAIEKQLNGNASTIPMAMPIPLPEPPMFAGPKFPQPSPKKPSPFAELSQDENVIVRSRLAPKEAKKASIAPSAAPKAAAADSRAATEDGGNRVSPPHTKRPLILFVLACLAGLFILVGGMYGIIRIATADGDYVIDTDDPDFAFSVSKGAVTLKDEKTNRKYNLKVVKQKSGEFELEVTDPGNDLTFNTKTFTIKRGEKVALKAWFERKQAGAAKASADPDRKAAEWVLSIGGTIRVNENWKDIKAVADLPREAFKLWSVNLTENKQVNDAGLACFTGCKNLTELSLSSTPVGDAGLAHFKDCEKLYALNLGGTQVTDVGLAHFKDCKNLGVLVVVATKVTDTGLAHFKGCNDLTQLSLQRTEVTDAGLANFTDCKNLVVLLLEGATNVSEAGLANFKDCKNLTNLGLSGTRVNDAALAFFKDCKNLETLGLGSTTVTEAGLAHFRDCKKLLQLNFWGTPVTDAGLAHFKQCESMQALDLKGTQVSDTGLAQLKEFKGLTYLRLQETKVTAAKIEELKTALPQCKIEWDGGVIEPRVGLDVDRKAIPVGTSPFDKLDPNAIPKEERYAWQPKELVAVIGTHARRHAGFVNDVAISPDGKHAASMAASNQGVIIVWDMQTQKPVVEFPAGGGTPHGGGVSFSSDSKKVYCFSNNILHTVDLAATPPTITTKANLMPANFSGVMGWMLDDGKTLIAIGSAANTQQIAIVDISQNPPILTDSRIVAPIGGLYANPFVADKFVAYRTPRGSLHRASVKNGTFVEEIELPTPLDANGRVPTLGAGGKKAAAWDNDHLQLWDITAQKPLGVLQIKGEGIADGNLYAISSDGRWLTASYGATGLWRIDGPEPKFITWLDQTGEGPSRVAFSRDGNSAVVGNCHGFIRFWDLSGAEPKELSPLDRAKAHRAPTWLARPQISPRANRLMSATFDPPKEGTARFQLWDFAGPLPRQEPGPDAPLDLRSGTLFPLAGDRWLQIPPHESLPSRFEVRDQRWQSVGEPFGRIGHGAVSGDGKWMMQLSGANLGELKLDGWDVSGEPVQKWSLPFPMKGNAGNWRMDSSWQGTSFAVFHGDEGGELALFRNTGAKPEQTGTIPIKTPGGGYRAALSPDGRTLAHLRDTFNGDIVLEDISTGKPREILRSGEQSGLGYLTWVSFSPDGRHLAYASYSSIGVLDAKTLKPVYQWETTPGVTNWIDWAADGRHLLMHNSNQTIYVLRLQPAVFANR